MRDRVRSRRRGWLVVAILSFGWLVIQNTALLALFAWLGTHGAIVAPAPVLRYGVLVAAISLTVATAMIVGAAFAVAVVRARTRPARLEVRHV